MQFSVVINKLEFQIASFFLPFSQLYFQENRLASNYCQDLQLYKSYVINTFHLITQNNNKKNLESNSKDENINIVFYGFGCAGSGDIRIFKG